jgi:membrane-associated protease RseP (regulator of RpoE activity)
MADDGSNGAVYDEKRGFAAVRTNVILFLATVVTVFLAGAEYVRVGPDERSFVATVLGVFDLPFLLKGWTFAVPLLSILLAHEFGHYFAARYHRVPASLPYFIPLPLLSPLGTMGAVIAMPGRIRSRNALLDIGASGPIAGMVVALPVLFWGIAQSPVTPAPDGLYLQEGQSLLYLLVKWLVHGPIPEGSDVNLHPTAFAGWAGLLVTMLNLLPFGQLDGGHIAYALFGKKQDRFTPWVRHALLVFVFYNVVVFLGPVVRGTSELPLGFAISNSTAWLVWYIVLSGIVALGGRDHPPFEPGPLSPFRTYVAWFCLVLFLVLFMPTPYSIRI